MVNRRAVDVAAHHSATGWMENPDPGPAVSGAVIATPPVLRLAIGLPGQVQGPVTHPHRVRPPRLPHLVRAAPPRPAGSGPPAHRAVSAVAAGGVPLQAVHGVAPHVGGHAALPETGPSPAQEARHLARAHVAALRDAAAERRVITDPDLQAARELYRAIVALNRRFTAVLVTDALTDSSGPAPRPPAAPAMSRVERWLPMRRPRPRRRLRR